MKLKGLLLGMGGHSCNWGCCTRHWLVAISTTSVDGIECSSKPCNWSHLATVLVQCSFPAPTTIRHDCSAALSA